ncbi:MAG TPA: YbhB/YbcL family Raf kinase inhibitor-like protein [Candidatus Baltobacteraceae bacterium]|nr:YbhB/YbcL family Raf kinase inhibitor-like protein [Candidatus Baltobacteraceae bacterium]
MRFRRLLSVSMMTIVPAMMVAAQTQTEHGRAAQKHLIMTITGFADGSDIPLKFTQAGSQISPEITWINTPAGTVTFLLHMHDMDFSRNHTTDDQLHWLVWNIPGTATGLPEGVPKGDQLQNGAYQISASGPVYRGPGAPASFPRHHYAFELFALDTKIDVQPGTDPFETRAEIMKAIQGHVLEKAVYIGLFHRPE